MENQLSALSHQLSVKPLSGEADTQFTGRLWNERIASQERGFRFREVGFVLLFLKVDG
jgi:hypothetical protein